MRELTVATLVSRSVRSSAVLALLLGPGCVGGDPPTVDLAMGDVDLAPVRHDLAVPGDLAMPTDLHPRLPDMAIPVTDLAGTHLTGLPTCTVTGVTADALFADVAQPTCASVKCHSTGAAGLTFTSGATLKSALVGVSSVQLPLMPLVTAGSLDASYVMYKLTGQHKAIGPGDQMPKGAPPLSSTDLCKFMDWITEGAK